MTILLLSLAIMWLVGALFVATVIVIYTVILSAFGRTIDAGSLAVLFAILVWPVVIVWPEMMEKIDDLAHEASFRFRGLYLKLKRQ